MKNISRRGTLKRALKNKLLNKGIKYNPDDLMIVKLLNLVEEGDGEYERQFYEAEKRVYIAEFRQHVDHFTKQVYDTFYIIDKGILLDSREELPLQLIDDREKLKRNFNIDQKMITEEQVFELEAELNDFVYGNSRLLSILEDKD